MKSYIHKVQYYETDKMGITHHSNYIRWMEEARVDFLEKIGYGFDKLEGEGITSPVLSVNCEYKESTKFNDEVLNKVKIKEFKGVRLIIEYVMTNNKTGNLVAKGETEHCFMNDKSMPVILKKASPEFDKKLKELA